MKIFELLEDISQPQLNAVQQYATALWHHLGVDIQFTHHFLDRVNDERNGVPITPDELIHLFKKEYAAYGDKIAELAPNSEAVMKDLMTKINIPFVVTGNPRHPKIVAKTVMRKPNFKTTNPEYKVR